MDDEKYVKYHQKTEIYSDTISSFENDDSVVLANKIKGLETYVKNFKSLVKEIKRRNLGLGLYDFYYADLYRSILNKKNFDNVGREVKNAIAVSSPTFVYSKQLDPETRTLEYFATINMDWFNSYIPWIEKNLNEMKNLLAEKKKETKEKRNEEVLCLCGRTYTLSNKQKHFNSAIHKKNIEIFKKLNPDYKEPEKEIGNHPEYHETILQIIRDNPEEFSYSKKSYDYILDQLLTADKMQEQAELEKQQKLEKQRLQEERQRLEDERIYFEILRQEEEERKEREAERKEYLKEFYEKQKQEPEIIKPKKSRIKKV